MSGRHKALGAEHCSLGARVKPNYQIQWAESFRPQKGKGNVMAQFIGAFIIFAALTALAFMGLSLFWHLSTVVFVALGIPFTWKLLAAMVASGWATSKIA